MIETCRWPDASYRALSISASATASLATVSLTRCFALIHPLQHDKHPARVVLRVSSRKADNRLNRFVLHDDVYELRHLFLHCVKRNILRGLYRSHNPARVLLRKEALRNVHI